MSVLSGVDLLIGIDDTDNLRSPGTGRRARALLREVEAAGLARAAGATRHQLLVDDRIPYTSHNSSACLALCSRGGDPRTVRSDLIELAGRFLERVCPPDADPGLAVAIPAHIDSAALLVDFGRRAKVEVLCPEQAHRVAATTGIHLSGHGGTHGGVIGALAAVGLHLSGNDGLFITLPGLEGLPREMTVDDLYAHSAIDHARDGQHREPRFGEVIELGDWVRPVLLGGRVVLLLDPAGQQPDGRARWRTAPRAVVRQY
ncbi:hypothetical protein [Mycobacterium sp. 1423905.2]|uniref:hypothetical protein n=1 Tax=Mycobacterium sp. 1423905.2 TaxID=1856859 RepID=UPI0007FC68AD|nr:hypothetical protein [Mycobacterium sp. 1423905.2]OBJ55052.1 hypothetical protein A9W95_15610 [Mycobacterium sp. 1423905.2]